MGGLYKRSGLYLLWACTLFKRLNSVQRDTDTYNAELNNLVLSMCACYETEHLLMTNNQLSINATLVGIDKVNIDFKYIYAKLTE